GSVAVSYGQGGGLGDTHGPTACGIPVPTAGYYLYSILVIECRVPDGRTRPLVCYSSVTGGATTCFVGRRSARGPAPRLEGFGWRRAPSGYPACARSRPLVRDVPARTGEGVTLRWAVVLPPAQVVRQPAQVNGET